MTRTEAYQWLAERLELSEDECHIGLFSPAMCNRVVELSGEMKPAPRAVEVVGYIRR